MTTAVLIAKSERASGHAHDLLELAPNGNLNQAIVEALEALACLRQVVRDQAKQIKKLQTAVPSGA